MTHKQNGLPRIGRFLIWLFLDGEEYSQAVGDFEEVYRARIGKSRRFRARLWFWKHLFASLPQFFTAWTFWRGVMIRNIIKVVWRNVRRHRLYAAINIVGLTVSLTCATVILFHIRNESSFDSYHRGSSKGIPDPYRDFPAFRKANFLKKGGHLLTYRR